jgi:zinc-ribbon domain/SmpA / OmlA family
MPIQIACPKCSKSYNLADTMQGKNVKCKNCANVFLVGPVAVKTSTAAKSPSTVATAKGPAKPLPKKTKPADDDVMEVLPADDDDDDPDVEDRPARNSANAASPLDKPKKSKAMLWLLLAGGGGVGFLVLIACMGGLWFAFGSGFGKKVDQEAFNKLRKGMTESEVNAILGKPTNTTNVLGVNAAVWQQGDNKIVVMYDEARKASGGTGQFKDAKGVTTTLGYFKPGTQPPPNNPPPPPKDKPPKTQPSPPSPPPPPKTNKVNEGVAFVIMNGLSKDQVLFLLQGEEPTGKSTGDVKSPNGAKASETWVWKVGKGHLTVYFDKQGKVVDKEHKDLPKF